MLCLFVNLVFSNTVFTHIHTDIDGRHIAHSHPYLPSSGHHHSGSSFDQIAGFNMSVASFDTANIITLSPVLTPASLILSEHESQPTAVNPPLRQLRGPPCA